MSLLILSFLVPALCLIGVVFDAIVCYLSKGIDLYGDEDEEPPRKISLFKTSELKLNTADKQMS